MRLRGDIGVETEQELDRGQALAAQARSAGQSVEGLDLDLGFDGDPAERLAIGGRSHGSAKVAVGLTDALEGDRRIRKPGATGERPLTARHGVGASTGGVRGRLDDRGNVVRLDRVLPDPRIRERGTELLAGSVE